MQASETIQRNQFVRFSVVWIGSVVIKHYLSDFLAGQLTGGSFPATEKASPGFREGTIRRKVPPQVSFSVFLHWRSSSCAHLVPALHIFLLQLGVCPSGSIEQLQSLFKVKNHASTMLCMLLEKLWVCNMDKNSRLALVFRTAFWPRNSAS